MTGDEAEFRWTWSCTRSTRGNHLKPFRKTSRRSSAPTSTERSPSYLDHQSEIDKYLEEPESEFEGSAIPLEQANAALWAKIQRAKAETAQGERHS
jgi:hypothetical protein